MRLSKMNSWKTQICDKVICSVSSESIYKQIKPFALTFKVREKARGLQIQVVLCFATSS